MERAMIAHRMLGKMHGGWPCAPNLPIAWPTRETKGVTKIDLNAVWDDARAIGRSSRDLLAALAGMFVLLPGVIADQLMVTPETPTEPVAPAQAMEALVAQFEANWPVLLSHSLLTSFGTLAMLTLLLRPERPTVAESMRIALTLLPIYLLASLLQGMAVGAGLFALFVPGLYLIARFALVAPVAAAEGHGNPLEILQRSFALTRGNGWRILALLAVLFITASILWMVAAVLVQLVATLLLSPDLADLALSVVVGLLETGLSVLLVLISAALYRAATAQKQDVAGLFR
jgi:hypothetical protein